jgi:hypothetical protein
MEALDLPTLEIGLALLRELFASSLYEEALELSERLRMAGTFSTEAATLQAICLDRLGFEDAAAARLEELETMLGPGGAHPIAVGRKWIGDGPRGRAGASRLRKDAMRFIPKLS